MSYLKPKLFKLKSLLSDIDNRKLLINIVSAFIIKGIALLISVFSMPMYIKYFNNDEGLGLWYTLLSILSWVITCDLGLGNGLRNKLTIALTQEDVSKCKKLISSTSLMLIFVIVPVLGAGCVIIPFLDLNSFFNISSDIISDSALCHSFIVLFVGICCSFVLRVINSIIYALQKASINNFLSLITSVIPLIFIAVFKGNDINNNLIALSYVHIISLNFPLLVATFICFIFGTLKNSRPSIKYFDRLLAKQTLLFGLKFFFTQIVFMLLINTNEIIISKVYSPSDVVNYNIYFKLFTVIGSLYMLALTPMWSKVTRDLANRKFATIKKTNRILILISLLAAITEFAIVPFLQVIVNIWLGNEAITVDYKIALIFALYGSSYILNVVLTTVANGIGELKTQSIVYTIGVVLKIPAIVWFSNISNNWALVMLYNAVILLIFCVVQLFWINHKLNVMQRNEDQNIE